MELLIAVVIVALVAAFVAAPLRRSAGGDGEDGEDTELAELEIRKQAKYREIRDAEADHASGKLSDEDFERLNGELRREAVEILKRMDRIKQPAAD